VRRARCPRAAVRDGRRGAVGADAGAIDECIAAGLLTLRGDTVAFRHELARRAVEDDLSPVRRRELDGLVVPVPAGTSRTCMPGPIPQASTSRGPSGSRNVSTIEG
jgi:hypothetical protein